MRGQVAAVSASVVTRESRYSISFDYNKDGSIDAGDLSYFAAALGAACPP